MLLNQTPADYRVSESAVKEHQEAGWFTCDVLNQTRAATEPPTLPPGVGVPRGRGARGGESREMSPRRIRRTRAAVSLRSAMTEYEACRRDLGTPGRQTGIRCSPEARPGMARWRPGQKGARAAAEDARLPALASPPTPEIIGHTSASGGDIHWTPLEIDVCMDGAATRAPAGGTKDGAQRWAGTCAHRVRSALRPQHAPASLGTGTCNGWPGCHALRGHSPDLCFTL